MIQFKIDQVNFNMNNKEYKIYWNLLKQLKIKYTYKVSRNPIRPKHI